MIVIHVEQMTPMGDTAIVVHLGQDIQLETHRKVWALATYLEENSLLGMLEYVPSFTSVTIYYDVKKISTLALNKKQSAYDFFATNLHDVIDSLTVTADFIPNTVEIPVCYEHNYGPDLAYVAEYNKLSLEEVITIHTGGEYLTYMLGFAPGFPYLGGLSERIATPRRDTPRLEIPAGSVGIAGRQTGVYSLQSPGGWQVIGRTPLRLFRPERTPPTLIQMGNMVKFIPISAKEFERYREVGD